MATEAIPRPTPAGDAEVGIPTIDRELAGAGPAMADPGVWGVLAFATTSFMLGLYNAGIVDNGSVALVIPVALFFAGLGQFVVAIFEVIRGNTFGVAVFGSFAAFWVVFGTIQYLFSAGVAPGALATGTTVFLAMWAVLTFIFLIASLRTDVVFVGIFALLLAALIALCVGYGGSSATAVKIGGYLTMAFAVLGWYHGAADTIAATFGRTVLPVGDLTRRSTGPTGETVDEAMRGAR